MSTSAPSKPADSAFDTPDFQQLYEQYGAFVRSLVARLLGPRGDPEDLMQEVFLVALKKLSTCQVENPRAWLCQIAVRLAANTRRHVWLSRVLGRGAGEERIDHLTPEDVAESREATRRVYSVLEQLSEKRRTVFVLFEIQGLSGQEIADSLGCPLKTVYTRLFHARREFAQLHKQFEQNDAPGGRND